MPATKRKFNRTVLIQGLQLKHHGSGITTNEAFVSVKIWLVPGVWLK